MEYLQGNNDFYEAMLHSVDGYIFVCNDPMGENITKISSQLQIDFQLPHSEEKDFEKRWIKKIHPEDQINFMNSLKSMFENRTQYHNIEYRVMNDKGDWVWLQSRGYTTYDDNKNPVLFAGVVKNRGIRNQIDHTTGLLNKYGYREVVNRYIETESRFGVLLLDIDDFSSINDRYGQQFGDAVLRSIGSYIQSRIPSNAEVFSIEGNEYAIVMTNAEKQQVNEIYTRIAHHYATQKELHGNRYYCTFSGAYNEWHASYDYKQFLKTLTVTMHIVKKQGKNHMLYFQPQYLEYKEREMELIDLLRNAVENNFKNFNLKFQPQVNATTKQVKGAEALLRWSCDKYGEISPVEFIPLLEKTNMIVAVGRWVFKNAVEKCKEWVAINPEFCMSINVSYLQLFDTSFVEFMKETIEIADIRYDNIIVELTESKFISDKDLLKSVFKSVRDMGMKIAMDDFGTGYSSLGILKEVPADIVKIDKVFVNNIRENKFDSSFIRVVVELCHQVGIKVCLEGIEENDEMEIVSNMNLDYIQGYLYGRPVEPVSFSEKYLETKNIELEKGIDRLS